MVLGKIQNPLQSRSLLVGMLLTVVAKGRQPVVIECLRQAGEVHLVTSAYHGSSVLYRRN